MLRINELTYEQLQYKSMDYEIDKEDDIPEDLSVLLGQEKTLKALDFGLMIRDRGYNIYLETHSQTEKINQIKKYINRLSEPMNTPNDWCYVYNFHDPNKPKPISLKAGNGIKFKEDMDKFIEDYSNDLKEQFDSVEYDFQKNKILDCYKEKNEKLVKQIKKQALEYDFDTQVTEKDIFFIPILEEEKLSEDMFDKLPQEKQDEIVNNSELLQKNATEILKEIRVNQKQSEDHIYDLQCKIAFILLKKYIDKLSEDYNENEQIHEYIKDVEQDIIEHIDQWINLDKEESGLLSILPSLSKNSNTSFIKRYCVNLIVDNSDQKGAPVIYGENPTFYNLIGKVEHDSEFGNVKTDITKIKQGLMHKANGGFLILEVEELLSNAYSWYILKLMLKSKKIYFKELKESTNTLLMSSLDPIPIPLDVKIILVGSSYYYYLLYEYENSFKDLFKIKIFFDNEVDNNKCNQNKFIHHVIKYLKSKGIEKIDKEAMDLIMKFASRLIMNNKKLISDMDPVDSFLVEVCQWAKNRETKEISKELVLNALIEKENRVNYIEHKLDDMINDNQIMIDVAGKKVGQINALAVLDVGDYAFAKPTRITATSFKGKSGIINIEKESKMSGKVHDKGVHVLSGYLGAKYAKKFPLSLTCQICFEQNYSMVDGDSASSAELYAIISSLSGFPIRQDIAVTGSINQFGEIQPIGGVTYKVEGFFNVCKKKGFTGKQGVIIPYQNINELILKDEVLMAIKDKKFHIYTVKNVDEGLEILTGFSAEKIYSTVYNRLKQMQ